MYALILNNMTEPNIENVEVVKAGNTRQELVDFYKKHLAKKAWRDDKWGKAFKKDSPLEWFNPVYNIESGDKSHFGEGIQEVPENITLENAVRLKRTKFSGGWFLQ